LIRRFHVERDLDPVAEGAEFSDGSVAIRWRSANPFTILFASLTDAHLVHGHPGTRFVMLDRVVLCGRTHGDDDDEWTCDAPAGHADGCPPPTGRAARHAGVST
jgi:hypothetical protein